MIGILGGGQLGRMLALAGIPLGLRFRFLEANPEAVQGLGEVVTEVDAFCQGLTAATYEFENVPVELARTVAERVPLFPPARALEVSQDRLVEKQFLQSLGIPTAVFGPARELIYPCLLKTRRLGYDGKGQWLVEGPESPRPPLDEGLIYEGIVPFQRELAQVSVRSRDGSVAHYPAAETVHQDGILRRATPRALHPQACAYATRVLEELHYVGVLALEFFEVDGELVANEMAPRVHNAGHWTQDGAVTSQFENHLRAGLGLPLGSCEATTPVVMVNLIGALPEPAEVLAIEGAHLHLYGKSPRAGRKLGHVNWAGGVPPGWG